MEQAGYKALRRGRVSLPGQVYLLTTVCHERRRFFVDRDIASIAARALIEPSLWGDARLLAWVLMPDHWHGLVKLGPSRTLSWLMQRAKAAATRDVAARTGICRLWQSGFHDRALRADEDVRVAARYVVANPLRAGLVGTIGE